MGHATAPQRTAPERQAGARPGAPRHHVHGIVPSDAPPPADGVTVVRHREVAALVRPAAATGGSARRDLVAHAELLDTAAATTPVLPMRFGTMVATPEEAARDLLAPYHDHLLAALGTLTGRAQFTVRARYDQDAIVREVLDAEPTARRLHRQLDGGDDQAGRIALGEIVAKGVHARREADAATIASSLQSHAVLSSVQPSQSLEGYRIADGAFLVELDQRDEFENVVEELARRWRERARLRLLGPMAAYHFADHLIGLTPEGG